mgnify:FL=1
MSPSSPSSSGKTPMIFTDKKFKNKIKNTPAGHLLNELKKGPPYDFLEFIIKVNEKIETLNKEIDDLKKRLTFTEAKAKEADLAKRKTDGKKEAGDEEEEEKDEGGDDDDDELNEEEEDGKVNLEEKKSSYEKMQDANHRNVYKHLSAQMLSMMKELVLSKENDDIVKTLNSSYYSDDDKDVEKLTQEDISNWIDALKKPECVVDLDFEAIAREILRWKTEKKHKKATTTP